VHTNLNGNGYQTLFAVNYLFFDLILSSATQVKIISDCLKKYMFQNCMSVEALYSIFKTTTEHLYA